MRPFAPSARTALSRAASCVKAISQTQGLVTRRAFTSLPTLRPTLIPRSGTIFRSSTPSASLSPSTSTTLSSTSSETLDIVLKTAISTNPAFGALQIRCGPRPTMARSSRLVRKRRHGFLSRIQTRTGRRTLQRRRTKGRHILSN
ncbi:ribosomal protein L34 [Xylariales sp. AK1849]|nr:ribosomal protein L34 [Xylariales sp. AK1849]